MQLSKKKKLQKHVCRALQARRRQQIANEIQKIEGMMHHVVMPTAWLDSVATRGAGQFLVSMYILRLAVHERSSYCLHSSRYKP